jgi:hypothetical protein
MESPDFSKGPSTPPPPYTSRAASPSSTKEHATPRAEGAKFVTVFDRDAKCVRAALILCDCYLMLIWSSVIAMHYSKVVVTVAMIKRIVVQLKEFLRKFLIRIILLVGFV